MALVELDDTHFIDKRFERLGELTGKGKYDARGRVEDLWFICIKETRDVRTCEEIDNLIGWFEETSFGDLMVKARLAEKVEGGFRIRGVKARMQWLLELREQKRGAAAIGGAVRAAAAKRGPDGKFMPSKSPATPSRMDGESQQEPASASPSPPIPYPLSLDSNSNAVSKTVTRPDGASAGSRATWEAYRGAYESRYREEPVRNAKVNSQIKQFVERLGEEEAPLVAAFYLTHNDQFYGKKGHPVGLMLADAEKLRTEWKTNRKITASSARTAEQNDVWENALRNLQPGGGAA